MLFQYLESGEFEFRLIINTGKLCYYSIKRKWKKDLPQSTLDADFADGLEKIVNDWREYKKVDYNLEIGILYESCRHWVSNYDIPLLPNENRSKFFHIYDTAKVAFNNKESCLLVIRPKDTKCVCDSPTCKYHLLLTSI